MEAMNHKIGAGVLWNLGSLLVTKGANTLFLLFLTRLMVPEAFGLMAMATVVFELAGVFINSGLGTALMRSKTVSEIDLSTVFYVNLLLSSLAYVFLFLGAPFVAGFYNQLELIALIQVMGLVVFINAAKIVQTVVLSRKMDFKSQMKANALGTLISGPLAVAAAWHGLGVWSLVVQLLSGELVSVFVLWVAGRWHPKFEFSIKSFLRLFGFSKNLLVDGLFTVLFRNSYILVIGRFFSAEVTGIYFLAKKLSNLTSQQLTSAVQQATLPALSTLQDDDEALRYKYRQIMQLMMFLIAPVMALLAGLASSIFILLFDERWAATVPYLQLLCIVGFCYPLHALNVNLLNVKGRSDLVLKIGLIKKIINLALLFVAIPYGVFGIVVGQVIGTFIALIPNTYFSSQLIKYSLFDQIRDVIKPIFAALIAGFLSWLMVQQGENNLFFWFVGSGFIGVISYLFTSCLLGSEGLLMLVAKAKAITTKGS